MSHLLLRKPLQLLEYLHDHEYILYKMVDHLEDTSITEILLRLVDADEQTNSVLPSGHIAWLAETEFLDKILIKLGEFSCKDAQLNAAQVQLFFINI